MEEMASSYGGYLQIYLISSCGQPTRGDSSAWGLEMLLITPHDKK
jgi:hypothetical protein